MRCEEAAEYVSALFDGETIPRSAAEHVGACESCQNQLREYVELGVELRRIASLERSESVTPVAWNELRKQGTIKVWWQKGLESMRIPRVAFALLVAGVVVLGSSLAMVKVGARSAGNVAGLKIDFGSGQPIECALATDDKRATCSGLLSLNSTFLSYRIDLIGHDSNRVKLGISSKTNAPGGPQTFAWDDPESGQQQQVWFEPGETTKVPIANGVTMTLTGEWMDHVPTFVGQSGNHLLDPGADELRMVGPVLLQGKKVVGDMEGGIASATEGTMGVDIYLPGEGRFILSLSPLQGSVRGQARMNRLSFDLNGQPYAFVTGAPVTRGEDVWVFHDANFNPGGQQRDGYIGNVNLKSTGLLLQAVGTGAKN